MPSQLVLKSMFVSELSFLKAAGWTVHHMHIGFVQHVQGIITHLSCQEVWLFKINSLQI